jgi:threonine aldolase
VAAGPTVDLRSDTVTRPTDEMRAAMAAAEVGDDVYGEDPTVERLQSLAAAAMGKDAALFVPSGTMANQLAIRVLSRPGTEVLCGARAHVYRHEAATTPGLSGVQLHPLPDAGGLLAPDAVADAIAGAAHHLPAVSMLALENTYMAAGGRPWSAAETRAVAGAARDRDVPVHLDGARIWNAAIALETSPRVLCESVDTVMFCLSKGLGAPVGSVLCGPASVIEQARTERQRLGGGMRQAGVLAAAGIVALETMVDRLADDHARARRLAVELARRWPQALDPEAVRTNIVCARLDELPADFVARLARKGVRVGTIDPATVRLVTHADVDDGAIDVVVGAFDRLD